MEEEGEVSNTNTRACACLVASVHKTKRKVRARLMINLGFLSHPFPPVRKQPKKGDQASAPNEEDAAAKKAKRKESKVCVCLCVCMCNICGVSQRSHDPSFPSDERDRGSTQRS